MNFTSRRYADETIAAGYLMGDVKVGRLGLLGGVRSERTGDKNWAYIQKPAAQLTTIAQEPDPVLRASRNFIRLINSGSYSKLYPSIHATYDVMPRLKARASYSTSYGSAGFAALVPTLTVSPPTASVPTGSITISDAGLRPQFAKNTDVRLDYYTTHSGIFTVGYFKKKITDYLLTQEQGTVGAGSDNGYSGDYAGYRIFQTSNAGNVDVDGWQFSLQQRLTFLPDPLKGLTLSANYTTLATEGDFGGILATTTAVVHLKTGNVIGFTPRTGNFMAVYNYRGLTTRVVVSYTGKYISSYSAPSATVPESTANIYREPLTTVNVGFSYYWKPAVSFSCDITNINEAGPRFYRFTPDRLREIRRMPSTVTFGVNGQF